MIPPFSYNFYLTVTLQVVFFEPLRIVIVAVPFFRPLITPPDVTDGTVAYYSPETELC